jgi:hypothetical protein
MPIRNPGGQEREPLHNVSWFPLRLAQGLEPLGKLGALSMSEGMVERLPSSFIPVIVLLPCDSVCFSGLLFFTDIKSVLTGRVAYASPAREATLRPRFAPPITC